MTNNESNVKEDEKVLETAWIAKLKKMADNPDEDLFFLGLIVLGLLVLLAGVLYCFSRMWCLKACKRCWCCCCDSYKASRQRRRMRTIVLMSKDKSAPKGVRLTAKETWQYAGKKAWERRRESELSFGGDEDDYEGEEQVLKTLDNGLDQQWRMSSIGSNLEVPVYDVHRAKILARSPLPEQKRY